MRIKILLIIVLIIILTTKTGPVFSLGVQSGEVDIGASQELQTPNQEIVKEVEEPDSKRAKTDLQERLIKAIMCDNIRDVKALLQTPGIDVNYQHQYFDTPLLFAAQWRHPDVMRVLLAVPDIKVNQEHQDSIHEGLVRNATLEDLQKPLDNGLTLLNLAAQKGYKYIAGDLVKSGVDVSQDLLKSLLCRDLDPFITLLYAAGIKVYETLEEQIIENLVGLGDLNRTLDNGLSLLTVAARNGYTQLVRSLVENGVNVHQVDQDDWTALMNASQTGHLEIVKILVECGSDVNQKDEDDWTSLVTASCNGHIDIVTFLLGCDKIQVDEALEMKIVENLIEYEGPDIPLEKWNILLGVAREKGYRKLLEKALLDVDCLKK